MRRNGWALAAVAVVALVIAGAIQANVTGGSDDEASTVGRDVATTAPAMTDSAGSSAAPASSGKAEVAPSPPDGGGPAPVVPGSPKVVRTADVRVKVAKGGFN